MYAQASSTVASGGKFAGLTGRESGGLDIVPGYVDTLRADMAPRWIQTKDYHNTVFEPAQPEDDWLLVSGELVVGRVLRDRSGPQAGRFVWSLTGPHGSP